MMYWPISHFFFFFTLDSLWNVAAKPWIGRMVGTVKHSYPHTKRKIVTVLPAHASAAAWFGNASPLSNTLWSPTHHMSACGSLWVPPPALSLLTLSNLRHMNLPMKGLETLNTSHLDLGRCVNISKASEAVARKKKKSQAWIVDDITLIITIPITITPPDHNSVIKAYIIYLIHWKCLCVCVYV